MKILGVAILLISALAMIVWLTGEEDKKLLRTRAWIELLALIRSSIDGYSMPASEILSTCSRGLMSRLGYPDGESAPQSLREIFERVEIPDAESKDAVSDFLSDFGKNYREHQVSRCDECIKRLRERESALLIQIPAKKKVVVAVTLCSAAAIVILLL